METKRILAAAVVGWVCAGAAASEYDFYAGLRYPGAKRRADVALYKAKQAGKGDPKAYERREVDWWPRRGVDVVDVKEGMPLRTWTLRTQQIADGTARLQAHLVGFRGMGNTTSNPFRGDGGPWEPGVVLRLSDGRKRCFVRGSFSDEDRAYIMDLYVREMKRIKAGLDKTPRVKRSGADIRWPNNAKPGQPGTMQVESEHFIWVSGSQAGSEGDPWVNEKAPDKAEWYRRGTVECAEYWWALTEYAGNLMPYWDRKGKFKHEVTVAGTKRDGHEFIGGYAGGGYGGCILKGAGGGPWAPGLWHEWGHGALANRIRIGGGEAQADMHQCLADPSMLKGNHHLKTPWRNMFNGGMGYGYTVFYSITGDDPNWGYAWFTCLPYGAGETSVLQAVARVGQQRGLFQDGIRGLGDMVGEYAARLATFDCELEDLFCRRYFAATRSWLEPVDRAKGIHRIPWDQAPEPFGVNIVRLVPDEGAKQFTVDFRGRHDPDYYSDWRACIVVVSFDGSRRYSPLWNKGAMTMACRDDDCAYWLTVAATPTALYTGPLEGSLYSGRHAYRYPWSVHLSGARPGRPQNTRADLGQAALDYPAGDAIPQPADTPMGKRYARMLTGLLERRKDLGDVVRSETARMTQGRRHANGGGWVANTAAVAASAYVGPDAMVLGKAKVLDHAIVDEYAVVAGNAVVSGHARVSGPAIIQGNAKVGGYSRTWVALGGTDVADTVPRRLGAERLHEFGLWAHYAMDRPENTLLEDWYRFPHRADRRYGRPLGPNLNGYLHGRPSFVVDGEHRGFRFDGKTQYGELSPRLADLGEITVLTTLRWAGHGPVTVFDFGSSRGDCFVLKVANAGALHLVARAGGKRLVSLTASKALAANRWVRLRVEIDGSKTALWVDGEEVAQAASSFRPCDAFPGGQERRNFLAVSRDGSGRFQGVIDRLVVYHTVHDDFRRVPPPIRDAPIRPTAGFLDAVQKSLGDVAELGRKIRSGAAELVRPYEKFKIEQEARLRELKERHPAFRAAEANLSAAKDALGHRKGELGKEFDALPEHVSAKKGIDAMRTRARELRSQVAKLETERFAKDEELAAIQTRKKQAEDRRRVLDRELRVAFDKQADVVDERTALAGLRKRIDVLRREVQKLEQETFEKDRALSVLLARRKELDRSSPLLAEVARKIREREKALRAAVRTNSAAGREREEGEARKRDRDQALKRRFESFRNSNEEYARLPARVRDLEAKYRNRQNDLRKQLRRTNPAVGPLERQKQDLDRVSRERDQALRQKRDLYIATRSAEMLRAVGTAEKALKDATDKALARYLPEKLWIGGFAYQAYRGYYNTPYSRYIGDYVRAQLGGGQMREDVGFLTNLAKEAGNQEAWRTRVDWDWRMRQEVDGTIADLPLQQKWIRRVRGAVVTGKPQPLRVGPQGR